MVGIKERNNNRNMVKRDEDMTEKKKLYDFGIRKRVEDRVNMRMDTSNKGLRG